MLRLQGRACMPWLAYPFACSGSSVAGTASYERVALSGTRRKIALMRVTSDFCNPHWGVTAPSPPPVWERDLCVCHRRDACLVSLPRGRSPPTPLPGPWRLPPGCRPLRPCGGLCAHAADYAFTVSPGKTMQSVAIVLQMCLIYPLARIPPGPGASGRRFCRMVLASSALEGPDGDRPEVDERLAKHLPRAMAPGRGL